MSLPPVTQIGPLGLVQAVVPFTFRDNETYLSQLMTLRYKMKELVDALNTGVNLPTVDFNGQFAALQESLNAAIAVRDGDLTTAMANITTLQGDIVTINATDVGQAATIASHTGTLASHTTSIGNNATAIGNLTTTVNGINDALSAEIAAVGSGLDAAVAADIASTASLTHAALQALSVQYDDYTDLPAAIAATPTGGTLEIRQAWTISAPLTINKAMTLRFARSGCITVTGDNNGINVTANNVVIDTGKSNVDRLVGATSSTSGTAHGIDITGSASSPVAGFVLTGNGIIRRWGQTGVWLSNVANPWIEGVYIKDVAYAGIMGLAVIGGTIFGAHILTVTQPAGLSNSYGIALTRDSTQSVANSPHSANVLVLGCEVRGVPFEGLDTHDGIGIQFINNKVFGCLSAIVATPGKDTGSTYSYAPKFVLISGNYCDSTRTDGLYLFGIQVVGAGSVVGSPVDWADGCIVRDNTIVGYGQDTNGTSFGAISAYFTLGLSVSGNKLYQPAYHGITLYHSNKQAVVKDNEIADVWANNASDDGTISAICLRNGSNTVTVSGNSVCTTSAKSGAAIVNPKGLFIYANSTNVVELGANDFATCDTPIYDTQPCTVQTIAAKGLTLSNLTTGTGAPSAGGAGALPATPAGYVNITIGSTVRKIPYY